MEELLVVEVEVVAARLEVVVWVEGPVRRPVFVRGKAAAKPRGQPSVRTGTRAVWSLPTRDSLGLLVFAFVRQNPRSNYPYLPASLDLYVSLPKRAKLFLLTAEMERESHQRPFWDKRGEMENK